MGKKKSKKNKNTRMPIDVSKAIWEEYSNIILEKFTTDIVTALEKNNKYWRHIPELRDALTRMIYYRFDFNRSNKDIREI